MDQKMLLGSLTGPGDVGQGARREIAELRAELESARSIIKANHHFDATLTQLLRQIDGYENVEQAILDWLPKVEARLTRLEISLDELQREREREEDEPARDERTSDTAEEHYIGGERNLAAMEGDLSVGG